MVGHSKDVYATTRKTVYLEGSEERRKGKKRVGKGEGEGETKEVSKFYISHSQVTTGRTH